MDNLRFLVIGDVEGRVRYGTIESIAERLLRKDDFIVFTGDYFSNQLTPVRAFKRGEMFPERNVIDGLIKKYNVVTAYGNKDIQSRFFGFDKVRSKLGIVLVEDFYGERHASGLNFCLLNGSNVTNVDFCKKAKAMKVDIERLIEKYESQKLGSTYKGRLRLRDLPEDEIIWLRKKYGETFKIAFDYPYISNYSWLESRKSDAQVLVTHSPPLLSEKAEVLSGYAPDLAIFKEVGKGVEPAHPKEKGAKQAHVGLPIIESFCKRSNFKVVFCGHVHEASGIALYKNTLIVNPGSKVAKINKRGILPFVLLETDENFRKFRWLLYNWDGRNEGEVML